MESTNDELMYKAKYLKYKDKYMRLKQEQQIGGGGQDVIYDKKSSPNKSYTFPITILLQDSILSYIIIFKIGNITYSFDVTRVISIDVNTALLNFKKNVPVNVKYIFDGGILDFEIAPLPQGQQKNGNNAFDITILPSTSGIKISSNKVTQIILEEKTKLKQKI